MFRTMALGFASVGLVLAACASDEEADAAQGSFDANSTAVSVDPTVTDTAEPEGTSTTPSAEPNLDSGLEPIIEMAIEDLSGRLDTDPANIDVIDARLVTWPDSSMGCPEPDKVYLPVVADGSVIELVLGDTVYEYHTGGDIYKPFLCEEPSGIEGDASSSNPLAGTPLILDKPIEKYPDETVPPPGFDD